MTPIGPAPELVFGIQVSVGNANTRYAKGEHGFHMVCMAERADERQVMLLTHFEIKQAWSSSSQAIWLMVEGQSCVHSTLQCELHHCY